MKSLYYKDITVVNDDSSIINKFGASLTDAARVIIYNCHMFIEQATEQFLNKSDIIFKFHLWIKISVGRHDTQHNTIQHNDTQHKGVINVTLSITMLHSA